MKLTPEERELFDQFTAENPWCWACGINDTTGRQDGIDYPRRHERHHIIRGAGRVHDRRNLAMLCRLCHDLHHGHTIRHNGKPLPNLSLSHVLYLKYRRDPPLDRPFLMSLLSRPFLPPIRVPPVFFQRMYQARHPDPLRF